MKHPSGESRRLAALLRKRKEELIRRWTERVLGDPRLGTVNRLSEPELHDHMPGIIDELARALEEANASEATGRGIGANEAAKEHARLRVARGFSLAEALREFSHFRAALVELCDEAGVRLEGAPAALVAATVDENMITEAAVMEEARRAETEQQAGFRERFMGILGHDLRSPLQVIQLSLGTLLARGDTTAAQSNLVRRASASADRMARMIHDLLDLTRVRFGGGIPINRRPAALDAIGRQVVDEIAALHPAQVVALDAAAPAQGSYDPDRMAQVVTNLVANALKHGAPGAPVRVSLREERDHAVLSVHNRGDPIPPDAIPHLFDPFWRGGPAGRSDRDDSLGLGLFIVKQIVEAHGGTLDVASTPEEGTTFTVRLPLEEAPRPGELQGEESAA